MLVMSATTPPVGLDHLTTVPTNAERETASADGEHSDEDEN